MRIAWNFPTYWLSQNSQNTEFCSHSAALGRTLQVAQTYFRMHKSSSLFCFLPISRISTGLVSGKLVNLMENPVSTVKKQNNVRTLAHPKRGMCATCACKSKKIITAKFLVA